jgi:hypothetical protein
MPALWLALGRMIRTVVPLPTLLWMLTVPPAWVAKP